MLQDSAQRSYGVQTCGLLQNRQKLASGHTSQLSGVLFMLYMWTVRTGVSVYDVSRELDIPFVNKANFLSGTNPRMFMICMTSDQFKHVGTGLCAGHKQHR